MTPYTALAAAPVLYGDAYVAGVTTDDTVAALIASSKAPEITVDGGLSVTRNEPFEQTALAIA